MRGADTILAGNGPSRNGVFGVGAEIAGRFSSFRLVVSNRARGAAHLSFEIGKETRDARLTANFRLGARGTCSTVGTELAVVFIADTPGTRLTSAARILPGIRLIIAVSARQTNRRLPTRRKTSRLAFDTAKAALVIKHHTVSSVATARNFAKFAFPVAVTNAFSENMIRAAIKIVAALTMAITSRTRVDCGRAAIVKRTNGEIKTITILTYTKHLRDWEVTTKMTVDSSKIRNES